MKEKKFNQKELLYNPDNWFFLAFFLSPILPAIFYYRNSKLLKTKEKGKKVLMFTILFVIIFAVFIAVFPKAFGLIIFIEMIIAMIVAKKIAKTQISSYEKIKEEKNLKVSRNEAPLILIFLIIGITFTFGIPYAINKYLEKNYIVTTLGGETVYLKKNNIEDKKVESKELALGIKLEFGDEYTLSSKNEGLLGGAFQYSINTKNGDVNKLIGEIFIVPIEAAQYFDEICESGDCMQNYIIYPKEELYLEDLESFKKKNESSPGIFVSNGQKYYILTLDAEGDTGYIKYYFTYINDIRVIFSTWFSTMREAEKNNDLILDFMIF